MPLIEYDDMIEHVSSAVANEALCNSVLPRTTEARSLGHDAEALDRLDNLLVELRTPIKDQIFWR